MSKNKTVTEAKGKGSVSGDSVAANSFPKTLTAATREELFQQVNELKASIKDATLSTGAVGRNEDGLYMIQIDNLK